MKKLFKIDARLLVACSVPFTALIGMMIFGVCMLASCGPTKEDIEKKDKQGFEWDSKNYTWKAKSESSEYGDMEIRKIDGCEYIILKEKNCNCTPDNVGMVHKANCSNPIHSASNSPF